MVSHLHPGQIKTLADVGGTGTVHDHGLEAGGNVRLKFFNGYQFCAVLIASGEMTDEVFQSENI